MDIVLLNLQSFPISSIIYISIVLLLLGVFYYSYGYSQSAAVIIVPPSLGAMLCAGIHFYLYYSDNGYILEVGSYPGITLILL